ncbi:helix-turn-helix domain-containing protein [Aromatoleum buckelii]|uniref:Winged helix-turn helix domain-containing protein n=1 Tax=Aromatoleum buckelii TaxID=200254 RepID=A0ABX1N619_9RHOO|nr:winged helix-turn-helix domain-containing protein [Aromatoleum buckelii]MCK0509629.1 winged helix-turn-helix domain-containing protein [Aromatoleum buckelii]
MPAWRGEDIRGRLAEEFGVDYSLWGVYALLHRLGLVAEWGPDLGRWPTVTLTEDPRRLGSLTDYPWIQTARQQQTTKEI